MKDRQNVAIASGSTVRVGILHSLVGPLAISEVSLKDAELMAIAEINAAGGVLGKQIEPVIADGASEPIAFESQVRKLVEQDQVATIFGCWLSSIRKFILPTLEKHNTLLWYPVQYEGLEQSKNVFYTGACPNQQIEPAVDWLLKTKGNRFYLIGSDAVFSHTCHRTIKAQLKHKGGEILGEDYIPTGEMDFRETILQIKQAAPDVVFSTVNSDSNLGFYRQYQEAGIKAEEIPILAISVTEQEVSQIGGDIAAGHYAAHSYFQSLSNRDNSTFVRNFQASYGAERVTSDPVEAAYVQVYLWKQAVERAQSFDVDRVRQAAYGLTLETPGGTVRLEKNHHLWKPCRIGQILPNGQFQLIDDNDRLIKPQPWLGIDDVEFDASELVIGMLAEAAQAIQYSCELEQKSRELIKANQHLQKLTQRVELFKRSLSTQIRASLDLDTILTTAVREIRALLQIDRCQFLWCKDKTTSHFELSHEAYNPDYDPQTMEVLSRCPVRQLESLGRAILKFRILQIDDISISNLLEPESRDALVAEGFKSLLAAVVRTRSGQEGVIVCEHVRDYRIWDEPEVELMQDVTDQLAIAIDQAELYAQARTAAIQAQTQADQLQQTLQELQQTQAQLVQTEKMSSLGQLVAGIAHEINNPVNFIYGNINHATDYARDLLHLIQLYKKHYPEPALEIQAETEEIDLDFLTEDLPKMLASMRVGANRIRQIVLSLRNFSRLDEAEMKPVDIHEGLDSTLLILQNRFKERSGHPTIQLIKEYGSLPLIECYAGQMNQVFMNILVNAIDALEAIEADQEITSNEYTAICAAHTASTHSSSSAGAHPSPLPLSICIRTEILKGDRIAVKIHNNGPAIPDAVQQRLFDPFFTTKPIGKGTGLGLAISHQIIVEKHKGQIYCVSKPELGTEFVIEIPIRQGHNYARGEANDFGPRL